MKSSRKNKRVENKFRSKVSESVSASIIEDDVEVLHLGYLPL
jgi:hypothetical protein